MQELSMRPIFVLLLGVMMLAAGFVRAAVAQDAAVGVATYIEVMPQSMEAAVTSLKTEAAASRKDDGCQDVQVLREIGRDNRFVVLESWKDQSAFEAHGKAPHAQQFRDRLGAIETAPPDERVLAGFSQSPTPKTPSAHSVWVVTHVDVMPSYVDEASAMLKELGESSAKEPGNTHFVVAQQTGRPNHFTVSEIWADRTSFDAHRAAAQTRHFRDRLGPMLGALHDQRIYRAVE
jgi:quinol monooxygenase YgiN